MTRRDFIGFFLLGGAVGLLVKKIGSIASENELAPARFWKKL